MLFHIWGFKTSEAAMLPNEYALLISINEDCKPLFKGVLHP